VLKTKLTKKEFGELIFEAIVTMGIMYFIYMGLVLIFNRVVQSPPPELLKWDTLWELTLFVDLVLVRYRRFILVTATIVAMLFTWWRLYRRYKQMQLRHVLDELRYVAAGNFEHRIEANLSGNMNDVVHSINRLVESTVMAMEEERKIEQSKDELITNVSHDIRTPLTSIIGYLGLIEDKQYHSEEELLKYTHTAFMKAKQMKSLVEDLFEYKIGRASCRERR